MTQSGALWSLASASQALWPTFGNHRIYQLQPAETKSAPNVVRLLSTETECPPKVPIYPQSAPNPKPKFGRPLVAKTHMFKPKTLSSSTKTRKSKNEKHNSITDWLMWENNDLIIMISDITGQWLPFNDSTINTRQILVNKAFITLTLWPKNNHKITTRLCKNESWNIKTKVSRTTIINRPRPPCRSLQVISSMDVYWHTAT